MGLREFQDSHGIRWKVWNVTPDSLDKRTAAEDYMRDWQDGWLCFECSDSRRRLARVPAGWESMTDAELERLLNAAQVVRRRMAEETSGEFTQAPPAGQASGRSTDAERPLAAARQEAARLTPSDPPDVTRSRTFTDHRARTFSVALYRLPPTSEPAEGKAPASRGTVLRFISGSLVLDLEDWPDDWDRLSSKQLNELLSRAQPADSESIGDALPQRRRTDLPG